MEHDPFGVRNRVRDKNQEVDRKVDGNPSGRIWDNIVLIITRSIRELHEDHRLRQGILGSVDRGTDEVWWFDPGVSGFRIRYDFAEVIKAGIDYRHIKKRVR